MTDQQKKAVEEAADNYLLDGINYHANTISRADVGDLQQLASDSFFYGAKEVLNNPEKYGLVSTESIESYKHQRDFYRNKLKELKGGKSVTDGLDIDDLGDHKIVQS